MRISYKGILDKDHSWGVVATELCLALQKMDFEITMSDPIHGSKFDPKRIDPRIQNLLSPEINGDIILTYCVPPNLTSLPKKPIVQIYNYEFSQIPSGWSNIINNFTKLFLPSSNFARDIFIQNGVNPTITEVLHHGLDFSRYNTQVTPLDLSSDKFTFLCVSSPHYRKGLDVLLRAFGEEFATIENVELVIKTQIPKRKAQHELDIRKLLDETRAKVALPQVRVVTDYYSELSPLYRAAHCYVSPTRSECFGLTELEAAACGIPIIATNYGGYLDFLNESNAYLIRNTPTYASKEMQYWHYHPRSTCAEPDRQHLRQLMRHVMNNYKEAQQKAKIAYSVVTTKFGWDQIASQLVDLLDQKKLLVNAIGSRKVPIGTLPKTAPSEDTTQTNSVQIQATRQTLQELQNRSSEIATISSHTIIYNEEANILEFLNNIYSFFDEIILVDGGSTDKTVAIINEYIQQNQAFKIKLFVKLQVDSQRYSAKWNQPEQRNFALSKCTKDWVFMLDADERIDEALKRELPKLIISNRSQAFAFPRNNYWESLTKIRIDGAWFPNYSYRFWKNHLGIVYENKSRHCQPLLTRLQLPNVLGVKTLNSQGPFSAVPIHHLHYIIHRANEVGLYRANEKDVRTLEELNKGLKVVAVPSLTQALGSQEVFTPVQVKKEQKIQQTVIFVMENFNFYSGGRYHLFQEAYTCAKSGANVYLLCNTSPIYLNDYPRIENLIICANWQLPIGVRASCIVGTPSNCGGRAVALAQQHKAKLILVSLETPNFIREYRDGTDSTEEYWSEYKKILPQADLVLASAKLPATYLSSWAKVPSSNIELMPPVINDFALKKVGVVKPANTLAFVSRIVGHKRLDLLLAAIAKIQKIIPNPPMLDIIGAGSSDKVQALLNQARVKGRIFHNISDISKFQLIKRSKALITCSAYEGFGMSPIEGMICEVPVICSDLPIFHETLGERVSYYPLDNTEMLFQQLLTVIQKPETFVSKKIEAFHWVQKQYSIDSMVNRWKSIFNKLNSEVEPIIEVKPIEPPKVSICIIALNESEYLTYSLKQIYDWDCCHEIIIIEGSVEHYPKNHLSKDGLSGDGTSELIKNFPDPQNKIKYRSGVFKDKIDQRNEYMKLISGTHFLVLDADEFYSEASLELLKQDMMNNPDVELFTFDFSQTSSRTYFHLWYNFKQHVVGGYWDIPHNRIYKRSPELRYTGADHNHPSKPSGKKLTTKDVKSIPTRAMCVHTGFVKKIENQKDKNDFYVGRGEGRESDPALRQRRQMYIDCRRAYETWDGKVSLPHGAYLIPYSDPLPEVLLDHPYMIDPNYLLKKGVV